MSIGPKSPESSARTTPLEPALEMAPPQVAHGWENVLQGLPSLPNVATYTLLPADSGVPVAINRNVHNNRSFIVRSLENHHSGVGGRLPAPSHDPHDMCLLRWTRRRTRPSA